MDTFITWFNSLDTTMQLYWSCAIVASAVFAIQTTLTLIGIDSDIDTDVNADFDGDTTDFGGLSLFSIRSLINFLVGFGWAGVCLHGVIANTILHAIVCVVIGMIFGSLWFIIRKQTRKLESNGAYRIEDCVGKVCDVYLRIPAKGEGRGKVQVSINGSIHEIDAVTNADSLIPTGTQVKVLEVVNGNTLLVAIE